MRHLLGEFLTHHIFILSTIFYALHLLSHSSPIDREGGDRRQGEAGQEVATGAPGECLMLNIFRFFFSDDDDLPIPFFCLSLLYTDRRIWTGTIMTIERLCKGRDRDEEKNCFDT